MVEMWFKYVKIHIFYIQIRLLSQILSWFGKISDLSQSETPNLVMWLLGDEVVAGPS